MAANTPRRVPPSRRAHIPSWPALNSHRTVIPSNRTTFPSNLGAIPPSPAALPPSPADILPSPGAIPPSPAPIPPSPAPEKNISTPNPKKRKFEHFNDQILLVRCGFQSAQEVIGVHKSLITEDSKFFCSVVKPVWNKSGEAQPTVDLTDEDPEIFKIYMEFLYGDLVHINVKADRNAEYKTLFKAYVFGEKIMSNNFQNAVMSAIIKFKATGKFPDFHLAPIVYRGTPANSPLRKLLLDFVAKRAQNTWNVQELYGLDCSEFLSDVIVALLNERPPIDRNNFIHWKNRQEEFFKKSE